MAKISNLFWFPADVGAQIIRVVLTSQALHPSLEGDYGETSLDEHGNLTCWIDVTPGRDIQDATTYHELFHGCVWNRQILPMKQEEKLVEAMTLPFTHVAKALGFKLPRRPRGAAALEHFARKI